MISIQIASHNEGYVRRLVPLGVECYIVGRRDERYINVRTNDSELIATLKAAARL